MVVSGRLAPPVVCRVADRADREAGIDWKAWRNSALKTESAAQRRLSRLGRSVDPEREEERRAVFFLPFLCRARPRDTTDDKSEGGRGTGTPPSTEQRPESW